MLLQIKIRHMPESKHCIRNSQNDLYPAPGMKRELWGAAELLTEEKITVPAEKMKDSNNEEATEAASRSRKRHLVLRLVNVLMISLIGAL